MKRILITLILCFSLLTINNQASKAAGEIGIIDNYKIMNDYKEAKAAQKQIMNLKAELEKTFEGLKDELTKALQNTSLSDADKLKKQKEVQTKFETEKARFDSVVESVRKDIDGKIETAIKQVASEQGLSVVISNTVVYFGGKDITTSVLSKLQ